MSIELEITVAAPVLIGVYEDPTMAESDPIFRASPAYGITAADIEQWNRAVAYDGGAAATVFCAACIIDGGSAASTYDDIDIINGGDA
jgi:hypothetical protein